MKIQIVKNHDFSCRVLFVFFLVIMKTIGNADKEHSNGNPISRRQTFSSQSFDEVLKCIHCLKQFSSKHCLKEHYFTHTDERPYKCKNCSKRFKHASQLSLHKKSHILLTELKWPKLTDLLKYEQKIIIDLGEVEKIQLPIITGPKELDLPMFKEFHIVP